MYEISKERLLQIAKDSPKSKIKVKQWYPDIFVFEKGWYKCYSGVSEYILYFSRSGVGIAYGTMNGVWHDSLGCLSDWINERIDDDKVVETLVNIGKYNHKIPQLTNTSLWSYENEELKDGDGFIVYSNGKWCESIVTTEDQVNQWDGAGWYKGDWGYAYCYVYRPDISATESYGFYKPEYEEGLNWRSRVWFETVDSITKCTNEEIRQVFIQESINRGYTRENTVDLFPEIGSSHNFNYDISQWSFYSNILYTESAGNGGMVVYHNGVWANKNN